VPSGPSTRLAVLNAPVAHVVRDGEVREVAVETVVLDDLLELRLGDQVAVRRRRARVRRTRARRVAPHRRERAVDKYPDAEVLSGSFVVAGSGRFQATRVGR